MKRCKKLSCQKKVKKKQFKQSKSKPQFYARNIVGKRVLKQPKFIYKHNTTLRDVQSILNCLSLLQQMVLGTGDGSLGNKSHSNKKFFPSTQRQNSPQVFGSLLSNSACGFKTLSRQVKNKQSGLSFIANREEDHFQAVVKNKVPQKVLGGYHSPTSNKRGLACNLMGRENVSFDECSDLKTEFSPSVHELTCYIESFLFFPPKMSKMAEMMYT